jgi:hypothetical protein
MLIVRVESKVTKLYEVEFNDTCIFMYRERSGVSAIVDATVIRDIEMDDKIRVSHGGFKASFLSEKYYPFSMDEVNYGREVKTSLEPCGRGGVLTKHKTFVYKDKYLITREHVSDIEVIVKVFVIMNEPRPEIYDLKDLELLLEFVDIDLGATFSRTINDIRMFFNKDGTYLYHEAFFPKTDFISKKARSFPQMNKFLTLDIECFNDNGNLVPCAIGFYDGSLCKTYSARDGNYQDMFKQVFEDLLVSKYDGYTVYVHNLVGFDGVYLSKYLEETGLNVKSVFKNTQQLLHIKVSSRASQRTAYLKSWTKKDIKRSYSIKIKDSFMLLPHSLRNLTKAFEVTETKSYFPHKFLTKATINYIGDVPGKEY